jgi:lipoprotein-releasing system permease protein
VRGRFEFFIARRYLKAKRKQAVISVITVISVIGVAAGVMALVIALAIDTGFRNTLQNNLLSASAHVSVLEKNPSYGIQDWEAVTQKLQKLPHVVAASPTLYGAVFLAGPVLSQGAVLKGVQTRAELETSDILRRLKQGSLNGLRGNPGGLPGIILGSRLAEKTGMMLNSVVKVISPTGELTPFGPRPSYYRFRVVGIFETGFYDLDLSWAFTSLKSAQMVLGVGNVVNSIELKLDDIYRAPEVAAEVDKLLGPKLSATTWMEQNRQILNALKMQKAVTVITIGLIELVAALNIFITLVMMVMEKYRDIAILMSMGARRRQIRGIFMFQGVLIGVVGTAIGLTLGYVVSFLADHYRWIRIDAEIYSINYVPFQARWTDGLWVAGVAILVSFLATIYPARNATQIAPAEALRYE